MLGIIPSHHDFDHNVDHGDDHVDQGQPQLDHHGSGRRTLLLRPQLSQHGRLLPRLQRLLWRWAQQLIIVIMVFIRCQRSCCRRIIKMMRKAWMHPEQSVNCREILQQCCMFQASSCWWWCYITLILWQKILLVCVVLGVESIFCRKNFTTDQTTAQGCMAEKEEEEAYIRCRTS